MLIVAGEWTGATLNSEVNLLMQRKPFWFVLGFGLLCAESSMERDWPHVRPPQRLKRRKAWGGFPCDRWKRNPEQLEISGGFDVDTLSASDSVLAWDPVAEIWNGVGHLAEPRSKSLVELEQKFSAQILARDHNGATEGRVPWQSSAQAESIDLCTSSKSFILNKYSQLGNHQKWKYIYRMRMDGRGGSQTGKCHSGGEKAMVAKQKTLSDFFWTAFDYMFLDKMKK